MNRRSRIRRRKCILVPWYTIMLWGHMPRPRQCHQDTLIFEYTNVHARSYNNDKQFLICSTWLYQTIFYNNSQPDEPHPYQCVYPFSATTLRQDFSSGANRYTAEWNRVESKQNVHRYFRFLWCAACPTEERRTRWKLATCRCVYLRHCRGSLITKSVEWKSTSPHT